MNDKYILKKEYLIPFLRKLAKAYRLVAPVRTAQGDIILDAVTSVDQACFDFSGQTQNSAKSFLFPQQEVLFTYENGEGHYTFTPVLKEEPTIFFGLRSCDLSAILYMDVTFLQGAKDIYYLKRRENAVLITLGCNEPQSNCFCNATKGGPFLELGYDLQLTDLGDRYFVEPDRVKGVGLIRRWPQFFLPASPEDGKAQYQISLEARGVFKRQVHMDIAIKKIKNEGVDDTIWSELSMRCQDCGGCAYICPTCTCFSITDRELAPGRGERIRTWDACTFSGFSRMAGGHNPVDRNQYAVQRRFLHKLFYDVEKHGRPSCVGCGRCVGMCFGGVDIIRFIELVRRGGVRTPGIP